MPLLERRPDIVRLPDIVELRASVYRGAPTGRGGMDIDLRLVRYFVVVASELHFGRAAAQLFVSQPALSKQIKKLETQVGEQLLVRDSRHVDLTPRGQRFYDEAQQLLALADRLQRPTRTPGI